VTFWPLCSTLWCFHSHQNASITPTSYFFVAIFYVLGILIAHPFRFLFLYPSPI
jgi:hypothetical protein